MSFLGTGDSDQIQVKITKIVCFSVLAENSQSGGFVNSMKHKTFIDVNSRGVEAAAAPTDLILLGAPPIPPKPDVTIRLDRPSMFLIKGTIDITGTLLFIGAVYNPNVTK